MKGVTILRDEKNNRKILQVDIKQVAKYPNEFEDLMDILVAEARSDEPSRNWTDVKKSLKKKNKL